MTCQNNTVAAEYSPGAPTAVHGSTVSPAPLVVVYQAGPTPAFAGADAVLGPLGVWTDAAQGEAAVHLDKARDRLAAADIRLDARDALIATLALPAAHPARSSDIALLLEAFDRWGADTPRHILGDFAYVIWDGRSRTLHAARDPIGVKPFYYTRTGGGVVFSSDLGGLLRWPGVSNDNDTAFLMGRLDGRDMAGRERTGFSAIRRLPGGQAWQITPRGETRNRYWRFGRAPEVRFARDQDYAEALRELLRAAVADRMPDSGAVGTHVSGGLDSGAVSAAAALIARDTGAPPPVAFTWLPDDRTPETSTEHELIHATADHLCLPVHHCGTTASDVVDQLARDGILESTYSSTMLGEAPVQKRAAALGLRVMLSGLGGDQGISYASAGYYPTMLAAGRFGAVYRGLKGPGFVHRAGRLALRPLLPDPVVGVIQRLRHGTAAAPRTPPGLASASMRASAASLPDSHFTTRSIRAAQFHDLDSDGPVLRLEDWSVSGHRNGLTYRYPLFDRRILDFAGGLPPDQYGPEPRDRAIMRRALEPWLPHGICHHRDKSDPVRYWNFVYAMQRAMPLVGAHIDAETGPLSRAHLIDMDALREFLAPRELIRRGKYGKVLTALQILDF